MVTLARYFLENVTGWILELDRGKGIPYEGNNPAGLKQKKTRLEQEAPAKKTGRQKTLARELEWISASPKARHRQEQSARIITAYDALLAQGGEATSETGTDHHPHAAALGRYRHRGRPSAQSLRQPPVDR